MMHDAKCLYCGVVTGTSTKPVSTVCDQHKYSSERDERREVAAGMRPWVDNFWSVFFGHQQLPAEERRAAQAEWDRKQTEIAQANASGRSPVRREEAA